MRIIQTRFLDDSKCDYKRLSAVLDPKNICYSYDNHLQTDWMNPSEIFGYQKDQYNEVIVGEKYVIDSSGFYTDLSGIQPLDFYGHIKNMQKIKFLDDKTRTVMVVINLYNINMDMFFTIKVIYENMIPNLKFSNLKYHAVDLGNSKGLEITISLIFSIFYIISMIINLKDPNYKPKEETVFIFKRYTFWQKIKKFFIESYEFLKEYFRRPDMFETISNRIKNNNILN